MSPRPTLAQSTAADGAGRPVSSTGNVRRRPQRSLLTRFFGALMLVAAAAPLSAWSMPPAGAEISNRAEASYVPAGQSMPEVLYSNTVSLQVGAVEALTLTADTMVSRPAGAPLALPHVLTNTGNVDASFRFELRNLTGDDYDLDGLRLVHDLDGDGIADPGEPVLAIDPGAAPFALSRGQSAYLLVIATVPVQTPSSGRLAASLSLTATTTSPQPVSATVTDTVHTGSIASLVIAKLASLGGSAMPGARVDYQVVVTNIGDRAALPTPVASPGATPVVIDGAPASVLLLRDVVPAGARYVAGSLATSLREGRRIFRLPGDAPFSYRSNGDDAAAIEVAVALGGAGLGPNVTADMRFSVTIEPQAAGTSVVNVAAGHFDDGHGPANAVSNPVVLQVPVQRVGLAKRASLPVYERDPATGRPLGTARLRFSFVIENLGREPAAQVRLVDVLTGADRFGRYTDSPTPDVGEYTVLPGSFQVRPLGNGAALTHNPAFTGQSVAGQSELLGPGSTLPAFGAAEVSFEIRVNATGRDGDAVNTAQLHALLDDPAVHAVSDDSVDGTVPDANGDGDPGNDVSPTRVRLSLPQLTVEKLTDGWRRIEGSQRRYEIDYRIVVTNSGRQVATRVQVEDNLDCTFRMQQSPPPVVSWELVGAPRFGGLLAANPGYTGQARCTTLAATGDDPFARLTREPAVLMTDGSRHLEPGQAETIRYTVRVELDPLASAAQRVFDNLAIASAADGNDADASTVLAISQSVARVSPIDPSGVVYHAATRAPIEGARVVLTRSSCRASAAGPITADELLPVDGLSYEFGSDGAVSQLTDPQGRYAFLLRHPPVTDECEYSLAVENASDRGISFPSRMIPPVAGSAPGGAVQPQAGPPANGAPTPYYLSFSLGPGRPDVWNNHIPLDPAVGTDGLLLQKTANRKVLEIGQTLDYTIRVRNVSGSALHGLQVSDLLPRGLRLVGGSVRIDGARTRDPGNGQASYGRLDFDFPDLLLEMDREVAIVYRVQAGIGTPLGPAVNRASARSGRRVSNEGAWSVTVEGGVFSDEGYIVGKVILDCNRNGVQNHEEIGIPGVRLFLEDGTGVVTDVEGKFSIYGLRAITHVLKLDTTTLPRDARLGIVDNRNAGRPDSRFVDLKKGEMHRANFTVVNCGDPAMAEEVKRRRKALALRPDGEGEAVSRVQLKVQAAPEPSASEVRRRAASGEIGPTGPRAGGAASPAPRAAVFAPVVTDATAVATSALTDTARPMPPVVDLGAQLADADDAPGFVDLRDGDTLAMRQLHVRVKGRLGTTLRLVVNGRTESELRVGKRVKLAARQLEAWEYIGVQLRAGDNTMVLEEVDPFGNIRSAQSIRLVAPGDIGRIEIDAPRSATADPSTPVLVRVRLTDERGVPVTARTQLTLQIDRGRWEDPDLNPVEPGTQVFIEGGTAEFRIVPPNEPTDATVRVSSGSLLREHQLAYLPELRPLVGSGILEGVLDLRRRGAVSVGQTGADAFEQTLRNLSSGDGHATGRAAFFFKGTVKGEYLLTAAYDSDKDSGERLFRDIQPDRFYPIYGDSAARIFDAQSSQRLFVRIDHERSYLLYGDFTTSPDLPSGIDPRRLSQSNRAATGVKLHHETEALSASVFASRDNMTQTITEIAADGTSGPYALPVQGRWRENSERVEIVVRDRNQPDLVLSTIPLQRFRDYDIDPLGQRILFAAPVASLDELLNPRHIRVSLEIETGGAAFWVYGADVQARVAEGLQVGASVVREENPANPSTIAGATLVIKPAADPASSVGVELAVTDSELVGPGHGARIEWHRDDRDLAVRAQAAVTDAGFNNPASGVGPDRIDAKLTAAKRLSESMTLRIDGFHSRSDAPAGGAPPAGAALAGMLAGSFPMQNVAGSDRQGVLATVSTRVGDAAVVEVGVRASTETVAPLPGAPDPAVADPDAPAAPVVNDLLTIRGKLGWTPERLPKAQVYVEAERDVRDADKRLVAVGGDYQLAEQTRLYGRYELLSSLGSPFSLNPVQQNNIAVIGIDSNYLKDGRLFNELRLRDSINGRDAEAATGVRKAWTVAEGLRVTGGFERTSAFGGRLGNRSVAMTGAVEYTGDDRYRAFGGLEMRVADQGNSYLNSLGLAYKLDKNWSMLSRSTASLQQSTASDTRTLLSRQQVGFAWREVDLDRWNALARYEHYLKDVDGGRDAQREQAHIVSMHVNHQRTRDLTISGRYALKSGSHQQGGVDSDFLAHLVQGRLIHDLTERWDLSLQAAYRWDRFGAAQASAGVEAGFRAYDNLWMSLGYNAVGFSDALLAGSDPLDRGPYFRIRFKFDEGLLR